MAKQEKPKFPTEVVTLPSKGNFYPEEHPLSSGEVEVKYMTAKEEDILTSQNLIKQGKVIDVLLESLVVGDFDMDDMFIGDKNAVMIASRVLGYGKEYTFELDDPVTGEKERMIINLADCPFKKLPSDVTENRFEVELPISKKKITFKLLTGKDERKVDRDLKSSKKLGSQVSPELTTRLRHTIIEVDGDDSQTTINNFVNSLLARDSLFLRGEIKRVTPDIELKQEVDIGGDTVEVDIPMTVGFFWPAAE